MTWLDDLRTKRCQYTGVPLNRLRWNHTGWCYHRGVFQWQARAHHLHNWNTLEDHWSHRYTGMPLEPHWLMLASSGVQWQSSANLHNWDTQEDHRKTTGATLETHWLPTTLLPWHSSVHWGLNSRPTELPLDYHWIFTGSGQGEVTRDLSDAPLKFVNG